MNDDVRAFTDADLDALVEVSRAADGLFAQWGLDLPPGDPRGTIRRAEHVWVAGAPAIGFAVTETVDDVVHLGELAVHPDYQRRGIGTRLVDTVIQHAVQVGSAAVTLTTFRDVPWNAPWYHARGFRIFPPNQWGPELLRVWQREAEAGIMIAPRVAMRRDLTEPAGNNFGTNSP